MQKTWLVLSKHACIIFSIVVLKELAKDISSSLMLLSSESSNTGEIPEDWKDDDIVLVFRKGKRSDLQ